MRASGLALLVALATCAGPPSATEAPTTAALDSDVVTVRLSSFAFDPDTLRLATGKQIRLRLVNDSSSGHNFSAPAFFAASSFPAGSSAPTGGEVEVGSHQTTDIVLVPRVPGTYPVECTHPLHALFGMTANIEVTP